MNSIFFLVCVFAAFILQTHPVASASPPQPFNLLALAQSGPYSNSGFFLSTYHVGAGLNAAVGTRYQNDSSRFRYNATQHSVRTELEPYAYYLSFAGTVYGGEPGTYPNRSYFPMGINIGGGTNVFGFNGFGELLVLAAPGTKGVPRGYKALAICHNDKIDGVAGSGQQLFYRFAEPSARCSDVNLRAIS